MELSVVEQSAVRQRKDFNCYTFCEKLFDPPMIVDICGLRSTWCFVACHSDSQRTRGLANILDLAIAYKCIKNVLLTGVPDELISELAVFQEPMTSRLKANI